MPGVARDSSATALRLRPLRLGDESAARAAHAELERDGFVFLLGLEAGDDWSAYLARLAAFRRGERLPKEWVAAAFLVAVLGDRIAGRVSVRFTLNDALSQHGGHIGYAVRPQDRRKGFATEILRQALIIARAAGVDRILVSCDDENVPSARVIERNGGVLEDIRTGDATSRPWRRYWIA